MLVLQSQSCETNDTKPDAEKVNEVVDINTYLSGKSFDGMERAVVAGGCFWCVEAAFQQIKGVEESISGYSGGHVKNPSYKAVCDETTGHAEAVYLIYDPQVIDFATILDIFFTAHDPTTLNRQGNDVGESYRSHLFYLNDDQKKVIDAKISELNESTFDGKIVTQVDPYEEFWVAEAYHQDYYWINPNQSYVYNVSRKKVEKVADKFKDRLK